MGNRGRQAKVMLTILRDFICSRWHHLGFPRVHDGVTMRPCTECGRSVRCSVSFPGLPVKEPKTGLERDYKERMAEKRREKSGDELERLFAKEE